MYWGSRSKFISHTGERKRYAPIAQMYHSRRVRRVALTRINTRLTPAARDPPNNNIVLGEYQATSENLPELNGGKQAKTEAKKEIHFTNLGWILSYLR